MKDSHSEVTSEELCSSSIEKKCCNGESYYITRSVAFGEEQDLYLFPFLLENDGSPWVDANAFLFKSARDFEKGFIKSEVIIHKASLLLDYKIFCEEQDINLMSFAGRKPKRPTYRYFFELLSLLDKGQVTRKRLNEKTKIVYDFYKYLSSLPNSTIDMERVDSVSSVKLYTQGRYGMNHSIVVDKREQSVSIYSGPSPVQVGFIREYGEEIRPLNDSELLQLFDAINSDSFSVDERLMHLIALHTGARKQTILTMRMKHLDLLLNSGPDKDGTYRLYAGPGTGIDTKFSKKQTLHFPKLLVEQIIVYSKSKKSKSRRDKFLAKHGEIIPEDELYVFLSPEGEPHYMAKNDPRYKTTKSKPQGRNTYYMKKKLLKITSEDFPRDFTFHWLRATFALEYYRWLQPLASSNVLTDGDIISMVQKRMHHADRATTEHYLKLFDSVSDKITAQKIYEERVFNLYE